jgi:hypothetical protein
MKLSQSIMFTILNLIISYEGQVQVNVGLRFQSHMHT